MSPTIKDSQRQQLIANSSEFLSLNVVDLWDELLHGSSAEEIIVLI